MKARGDGLALELCRTQFRFGPGGVSVSLDGVAQPDWCAIAGSIPAHPPLTSHAQALLLREAGRRLLCRPALGDGGQVPSELRHRRQRRVQGDAPGA